MAVDVLKRQSRDAFSHRMRLLRLAQKSTRARTCPSFLSTCSNYPSFSLSPVCALAPCIAFGSDSVTLRLFVQQSAAKQREREGRDCVIKIRKIRKILLCGVHFGNELQTRRSQEGDRYRKDEDHHSSHCAPCTRMRGTHRWA